MAGLFSFLDALGFQVIIPLHDLLSCEESISDHAFLAELVFVIRPYGVERFEY